MSVQRVLDPAPVRSLDDHRAVGGLTALANARSVEPEAVISTVTDAGLRGRGGAGFPAGRKWTTVATNAASSPFKPTIVVNAAEGEPGTFGDRTLIRRNPYRVIEGALIAAHAIGAGAIAVVTKESFTTERQLLEVAAADFTASELAGSVDILVVPGPSHYLLGEETGLLEAAAGRPPFPRVAPPYRHGTVEIGDTHGGAARLQLAGEGGFAPPTLVNNVETLCHVPGIIQHGPAWFRELGTPDSPGTTVFTVTGQVKRGGVGEFPLGTTVREIIMELSGGTTRSPISFVLSGVANAPLMGHLLDTPATHADMAAAGSGLGTGGFIVFTTEANPISVAQGISRFLAVESCGQCSPCKLGGLEVAAHLDLLREGQARDDIIEYLIPVVDHLPDGARCDLGRQHERVVAGILDSFPEVVAAHAAHAGSAEAMPVAPIVDIDELGRVTYDETQFTKQPDWDHDETWNGQTPAERHQVDVTIT